MRTILLIRHAKSSWDSIGEEDIERSLNDRGKKNAPEMARRLRKKDILIDAIITSPAKRAHKTSSYFAEEYGIKDKKVILEDDLYHGTEKNFEKVISRQPQEFEHLAIFGHNPSITDFANTLTSVKIDNIPTCGVFAIRLDIDDWQKFSSAIKEFWFFDYPKKIE